MFTDDAKPTIHTGTGTIDYFKVDLNGQASCILDTPGFDDNRPNMTDEEIMRQIFYKLSNTFDGTKLIKGLVYMHDISQTRIGGLASRVSSSHTVQSKWRRILT